MIAFECLTDAGGKGEGWGSSPLVKFMSLVAWDFPTILILLHSLYCEVHQMTIQGLGTLLLFFRFSFFFTGYTTIDISQTLSQYPELSLQKFVW